MDLDWHFPVAETFSANAPKSDDKTTAVMAKKALPRKEAFYRINGKGNQMPLLVMRECVLCKGTEHALFDRRLNNEKTKLLCRWFYCVKLPPKVIDAKHAFRNLFPKKKPPHLFICSPDGSNLTEFSGLQTQSQLQRSMLKLIKKSYEKKPLPAVKAMMRFLTEFDKHDGMLTTYDNQLQKEMLRPKPRKSMLKKLKLKIAATKKKRAQAMKKANAVCDLKLSEPKPKSAPKKAGANSKS